MLLTFALRWFLTSIMLFANFSLIIFLCWNYAKLQYNGEYLPYENKK